MCLNPHPGRNVFLLYILNGNINRFLKSLACFDPKLCNIPWNIFKIVSKEFHFLSFPQKILVIHRYSSLIHSLIGEDKKSARFAPGTFVAFSNLRTIFQRPTVDRFFQAIQKVIQPIQSVRKVVLSQMEDVHGFQPLFIFRSSSRGRIDCLGPGI